MSEQKQFRAGLGFMLDGTWGSHAAGCERCRQFDSAKPATAVLMCLEGAILFKRDNAVTKREHVEKPDNYASKAEMRRATKYRE